MKLSNSFIHLEVNEQGAEITSIKANNHEYLWQADSYFWGRHSPILFPIVGRVWNNEYRIDDHIYHINQHGFARDCKFCIVEHTTDTIRFLLESDESTLLLYPYPFHLEIAYHLSGKQIEVQWKVINPQNQPIFFQIGAHPGFYWPANTNNPHELLGWMKFKKNGELIGNTLLRKVITQMGCVDPQLNEVITLPQDGLLPLRYSLFQKDAIILEDQHIDEIELLHPDHSPYLTMQFSTPLLGVWSPPGKQAPFVCIEPWYGRCDNVGYTGDFRNKAFIQTLAPYSTFVSSYFIRID